MSELIRKEDAINAFNKALKRVFSDKHLGETIVGEIPSVLTKTIKYYDEDEQVWKVGEVIVSDSEKPSNSTTEDCSDVGKE